MMGSKLAKFDKRESLEFGDLRYTKYFVTDLITSGIAVLPAGGKGDVDKGHDEAEEVFTVCSGKITVILPDSDDEYDLGPGDAILIPKGAPHIVENRGKEEAMFVFSGAPKL